ncbi:hypothetical protein SERLA73DRAFT_123494 [Serpula lacrymans var. lacrymans S7.3]|uniref:Secreted protein n=1 Tax=Serpula lacrymans var. lacrymans (strain S7.3) TaxID=936435 RepID=F8Q1D7_SERL3|nr:hypothetical protein SERLA73DRAFT_123494 [Serpula lacrymans var. lacrymans S7.3]
MHLEQLGVIWTLIFLPLKFALSSSHIQPRLSLVHQTAEKYKLSVFWTPCYFRTYPVRVSWQNTSESGDCREIRTVCSLTL